MLQNIIKSGAVVIAILTQIAFFGALIVAYLTKDAANLSLLYGAIVANATTTVSYYLGSSASSSRKTDLLAASNPLPTTIIHDTSG